ncbi:hypothetical protein CMK19_17975 [Candidatus Poribacteria bacterium]|nr:hypothetical protein [Candidatus Poribacteria bacterium]MEE2910000.1 DUF4149 domain-containing protein [Candidatus Poribacteria bacterium]
MSVFSNKLSILMSGIISGMILFQTAIVAPVVFRFLDGIDASRFLRSVFPKLFLSILILGGLSLVQTFLLKSYSIIQLTVSTLTIILMGTCYIIVPATNRARDAGNDLNFKRLHTVSVALTLIVLLVNLGSIFYNL